MSRSFLQLLVAICAFLNVNCCPCSNVSLCDPVKGNFKEVFVFVTKTTRDVWQKFDWNKITTIALFDFTDDELMCFAHKRNVRVVFTTSFPTHQLLNDNFKRAWIQKQVAFAKRNFLDGINVDYEDPLQKDSKQVAMLTDLLAQLRHEFHESIPGSKVSFDVPWSPLNDVGTGVDGRNYDFVGLANNTDYLFIMSYDIQSQMFFSNGSYDSECYARANSGLYDSAAGLMAYLRLGINSLNLVFGQPWYGYDYECLTYDDFFQCKIKEVPFRGVNCSDAAGTQLSYSNVMNLVYYHGGHIYNDEHSGTHYVLYKDKATNKTHTVWYDDRSSMWYKVLYASQFNLRGVGIWTANYLNYTRTDQIRDMWGILPSYKKHSKPIKCQN